VTTRRRPHSNCTAHLVHVIPVAITSHNTPTNQNRPEKLQRGKSHRHPAPATPASSRQRHKPEAEKFQDVQSVIATKKEFRLVEVSMVLIMHDVPSSQWDVVLPLID
jgi:hypothetical protein